MTYNDVSGLRRTLESVRALMTSADGSLEVIVMDGGTAIGLEEATRDFPWAQVDTGRDGGIYDAMNKGMQKARGQFIWFLNGGDECLVSDYLDVESLLRRNSETMILADYELAFADRSIHRRARPAKYIWHGLPTSHQAILYPTVLAKNVGYDPNFTISADYQLTAQMLTDQVPARVEHLTIARFYADGVSSSQAHRVAAEARQVQKYILGTSIWHQSLSQVRHRISRLLRQILSNH
ncbi:glycosyltransferase [Frondihabitans sp. PAMC 28766]|uniref:glycosyltransferase n=1 Tax=Frondihabitans sp. PAMC 28766 TaxID=1795630 RepID=UPI0012FFB5D4|nr:glycosyltransferase [Frondihabitans sp. PAMC 28766]